MEYGGQISTTVNTMPPYVVKGEIEKEIEVNLSQIMTRQMDRHVVLLPNGKDSIERMLKILNIRCELASLTISIFLYSRIPFII